MKKNHQIQVLCVSFITLCCFACFISFRNLRSQQKFCSILCVGLTSRGKSLPNNHSLKRMVRKKLCNTTFVFHRTVCINEGKKKRGIQLHWEKKKYHEIFSVACTGIYVLRVLPLSLGGNFGIAFYIHKKKINTFRYIRVNEQMV